mgnify:CR=1 FL=1
MKKMRGITLIALIITIIVMLILVGVTVTTAINGGLFKQAQKAKTRHEEEYIKEQIQIALVSSIDERLMEYEYGTGGNVNLLVLKQELKKIFATKVETGKMIIRVVIPGDSGYVEASDEYLEKSYEDIFAKTILNELGKALLDLGQLEIETDGKIFTVTSTGKVSVETIGEITTNGEKMSLREISKAFKLNNGRILEYYGKEKTVKIPKAYYYIETLGENTDISITQLGDKPDPNYEANNDAYWSIFLPKGSIIPINSILDPDEKGLLKFKEENYTQIKEALTSEGLDLSSVSNFEELKKYMHAYQEDGEWYTTYIEQEDGTIKFIDKSELSGVETVVIPDTIKKVWCRALAGDPFLTKVYIPASLISQESANAIESNAFEGASSNLKIYITTPEGWGETQKNAAISKFYGFEDLTAEQFIWSDEEGYINP